MLSPDLSESFQADLFDLPDLPMKRECNIDVQSSQVSFRQALNVWRRFIFKKSTTRNPILRPGEFLETPENGGRIHFFKRIGELSHGSEVLVRQRVGLLQPSLRKHFLFFVFLLSGSLLFFWGGFWGVSI